MSAVDMSEHDPEILPPLTVRIGFGIWAIATAFVILALTAYTYSLDDIKIPGLYVGGAVCLAVWFFLLWRGDVEAPPALFTGSFAAYLIVCVASTFHSESYGHWAAWQYVGEYLCAIGFTLLGASVLRTKRMLELSMKFWVALTLITTVFGLLHYGGFLGTVYSILFPHPPSGENRLHDLLYTFKQNRSMLSTILNVQFFGNFLLMVIPAMLACAMLVFRNLQRRLAQGDSIVRPVVWIVISASTVVFSLACIFTTFSKSSVFLLPLSLLAFAGLVFWFSDIRRAPMKSFLVVAGVLALALAVMGGLVFRETYGDFQEQFKNIGENIAPRKIMFSAAWEIFRAYPVLGGGPGSYRFLFSEFRSPDYHLTRISNVTTYCHNWLLDILAETGVFGAITYLLFLFALIWFGFRALRTCTDVTIRVCIIGCVVGVGSILAGSMTTPMTRWPVGVVSLHAMLGTAMGAAMLGLRTQDRKGKLAVYTGPPAQTDRRRQLTFVMLAGSIAYAIYIVNWSDRIYSAAYFHNEGIKRTDLPESYFGKNGLAENPAVIDMVKDGIDQFQMSLKLDPARPTTYYKLAHAYNRLGDEANSLQQYLTLQTYFPDYSEVHYNLGVLYYNLAIEAAAKWKSGVETKDTDNASRFRDETLLNYDKSIAQFDRQSKLSNKISVWYFRGNVKYLKAQKLSPNSEEAKSLFLQAGDDFTRTASLPVSSVIQEAGQQEREEELKITALKLARDAYKMNGNSAKIAEASLEFLKAYPISASALREAVEALAETGQKDLALKEIDQALERNPLNSDALLLKAATLKKFGDDADAARQIAFVQKLAERLSSDSSSEFLDDGQKKILQELMTEPKSK